MSAVLTLSLNISWTCGSWLRCLIVFCHYPELLIKINHSSTSWALLCRLTVTTIHIAEDTVPNLLSLPWTKPEDTWTLSPHAILCFLAKHCGIRLWDADFHPKSLTLCTCACWRSESAPLFTAVFKKQGCESLFGVDLFEWLFICLFVSLWGY